MKKSTMTLPRVSWHHGRKANTAMPVPIATSSKSPRTGAEKAARPAMLTVVSRAMPARMTPPKIASQRAIR